MEKVQNRLLRELSNAISNLNEITEFSKRELKAISILSINPFYRRFFTSNPNKNLDYVDNKKHLKRKFEKTLMKVIENVSNALGNTALVEMFKQNQDLSSLRLGNLFNK